jgi:MinD-like ATPase involved in chromosome partitioning or flagellar assembly
VLNAVLFIADPNMAALLRGLAGTSNEFAIDSIVELTSAGYGIARTMNTSTPDAMLVEMSDARRDPGLAAALHQQSPNVPLVGLASRELYLLLGRNPNSDIAAMVSWPFGVGDLNEAISVAVHKFHGGIHENLIAFLPGKAGSGASTVVLQTARISAVELKRKVLVMESDLHSGLLSAMLRVPVRSSIRDALADAARAGSMIWQRYVAEAGGVDFLLTNTAVKEPVPSWTHYFQLLRFAAPKYDLMMVDLPEVVNTATAEVVRRARSVYVVSTPEFASLKLAQQRCRELENWGVERGRIQALLNRGHKSDISAKDAEQILEFPVAATFPNDYKAMRRASADGGFIETRSDLGQAYLSFAKALTGAGVEKKSLSWFRK